MNPSGADYIRAIVALALSERADQAHSPDVESIAAWRDGLLPRGEVEPLIAHVAYCQECYSVWTDLIEAEPELTPTPAPRPGRERGAWQWRPRLALGGFAAALIAAFGIGLLVRDVPPSAGSPWMRAVEQAYTGTSVFDPGRVRAADWLWGNGLTTRQYQVAGSADAAERHERAGRSFGIGVREALSAAVGGQPGWDDTIDALPGNTDACTLSASADCGQIDEAFQSIGRWAVLLHFACRAPTLEDGQPEGEVFWPEQTHVMLGIGQSTVQLVPSGPFDRFFSRWRDALSDPVRAPLPRDVLCEREAGLLSLGLD